MKRFPINKYISILFCILILAGKSIAADSFKNTLLKTDLYRTSTGGIRINLYTSNPYSDSVVINKLDDNQYVILLPETSNSVVQKLSLEKFSDDIKDINIKTQPYIGNFKGYTKIIISTNKPVLISPQVLVLNTTAGNKSEKNVQTTKAQNNVAKKETKTQQTARNNVQKPVQTLKSVQKNPAPTPKNNNAVASKKAPQKVVSKPQPQKSTAKASSRTKLIANNTPSALKTIKPIPVVKKPPVLQPKNQVVKPPLKPAAEPNEKAVPIQAPKEIANPVQAPAPPAQPTTPTPTAAPQPQPYPQPSPMPSANNSGFASYLNIYTIGGTALGLLLLLLLIAKKRRNKVSKRSKNNYANNQTDYMKFQNDEDNTPQDLNDLLDSGGSIFSVAKESGNLNEQEPEKEEQTEQDDFNDNSQLFSQEFSESFDNTQNYSQDTPDYINDENINQVDDLFASEDFAPDETADNSFNEEVFGQYSAEEQNYEEAQNANQQFNSQDESEYQTNNDAEFEALEQDYQQNIEPEVQPEPSPEPNSIQEQEFRTIPKIPTVPTIPTGNPVQGIDEQDFTQIEDEMSLDKLNELENNNIQTEEPSIEELFAEEVGAGVNDLTSAEGNTLEEEGVDGSTFTQESSYDDSFVVNDSTFVEESTPEEEEELFEEYEVEISEQDLEEEIKIVEPFNQKFDESQIEKIKMPEKFDEVQTVSLPEEETVEEINFEQQPTHGQHENNGLQHFEDFETVAQPEEVVKSEFDIDDEKGFYMVDYLDYSILVGHIGEEIFILKKFEEKIDDKLQARLNEKKGNVSNYMVKVAGFKGLVEVSALNMKLMIEL